MHGVDGGQVACYSCGALGAVGADGPFDPVADRPFWPHLACMFTPGCHGHVVPEVLN